MINTAFRPVCQVHSFAKHSYDRQKSANQGRPRQCHLQNQLARQTKKVYSAYVLCYIKFG